MDHASDHFPVTWNLFTPADQHSSTPPDPTRKFTFRQDKKKEWKEQLSQAISLSGLAGIEFDPPIPPTTDYLSKVTDLFQFALEECSRRTCKTKPLSSRASPWFTTEVQSALVTYNHAKLQFKQMTLKPSSRRRPPSKFQRIARYHVMKQARRRLQRIISKAKKDWAFEFAAQIEPLNIWKLNNWHKGLRKYSIPPIRKPDGSSAISDEDKATVFTNAFFPPPPQVVVPPFSLEGHECARPHQDVTISEVERNLKSSSQTSAPGQSGISFRALRWAWEVAPELIHYIVKWSIHLGYHHPSWKSAVMLVLPKPGKPDYTSPRAYRPIQLLECLGKLVEKIVARRIMFDCSKFSLMPPEQFGGVMAASCIDAGLSLTHDIESALRRGHTASLLTVDVKGFFDNINHAQLLHTLHDMHFPGSILKWVSSFLSNRSILPRIDGYLGQPSPLSTGVPQGSPISPILSVVYSSTVIRTLSTSPSLTPLLLYPTTVRSYIDDVSFLAIGADTEDTTSALQQSFLDIERGLAEIGMNLDPTKSELIHFSHRHHDDLTLPLYISSTLSIYPSSTVRWLGIFFDSRLTFTKHVDVLCNRARTAANGLRVLANTVRGLSQKNLRALHKTCILPIITWAAVLWYRKDLPRKSLLNKLERIQNISLRLVCGAFRTTPVGALQVLAHQPPIELTLARFSSNAALRLSRLPTSSPVFQRLPMDWRNGDRGNAPIPPLAHLPHNDSTSTKRSLTALEYLSSLNHPLGERMFQFADANSPYAPRLLEHARFKADTDAIPKTDTDRLASLIRDINNRYDLARDPTGNGIGFHLYFCDGSAKDGRTGAGVHHIRGTSERYSDAAIRNNRGDSDILRREQELTIGGGRKATSFDAEMIALVLASKHICDMSNHPSPRTEINIFSDSVAALKLITDPSPHPAQALSLIFIKNIFAALDRHPDLVITMDWCPGHSRVQGNERADYLANDARTLRSISKYPTCTFLKTKSAKRISKKWQVELNKKRRRSTGSLDFAFSYPLSATPSDLFKETTKELFGRLTQTLTGHGYTGEFYSKFQITDASPWCLCSSTMGAPFLHTRRHVLSLCPRHTRFRHILKDNLRDPDLDLCEIGDPSSIKSLLHFMHVSGAFTKLDRPFSLDLILPPEMRERMRIPCHEPP